MLGSLTLYKRLLNDHFFNPSTAANHDRKQRLPVLGHAIAGIGAGWTVSFIAAPIEHVKARLQVQYSANKAERLYKGPVDCIKKLVRPIQSS